MPPAIARFGEHLLALEGRATRTAAAYSAIATAFLESLRRRRQPTQQDAEQFLGRRLKSGERPSVATRNQSLSALRAFARFATSTGYWKTDPTTSIRYFREPPHDPVVLSVFEVHRFFRGVATVSAAPLQRRDRAILALLFTLGLRVHELVGLNVDQVDLASATLVSVRGKGGTMHDLPVQEAALKLIARWLSERAILAKPGEHALFVSTRGTRMCIRSVQRLFERLRTAAGTRKKASPHSARHTFVTTGSQRGAEISALSLLARHTDVNTTLHYNRVGSRERRRVVELLGVVIPPEIAAEVAHEPSVIAALAGTSAESSQFRQLSLFPPGGQTAANHFPVDVHQPLGDSPRPVVEQKIPRSSR